MTASDYLLAGIMAKTPEQKDDLIEKMNKGIQNIFGIIHQIEDYAEKNNMEAYNKLAKMMRDAL